MDLTCLLLVGQIWGAGLLVAFTGSYPLAVQMFQCATKLSFCAALYLPMPWQGSNISTPSRSLTPLSEDALRFWDGCGPPPALMRRSVRAYLSPSRCLIGCFRALLACSAAAAHHLRAIVS